MDRTQQLAILTALVVFAILIMGAKPKNAYDFKLYRLDDSLYSLERARSAPGAKLVVVDFFSLFCEPCKHALPAWNKLHGKFGGKGLEIVLVAIPIAALESASAAREKLADYFRAHPVPFDVVVDKYSKVAEHYGVARGRTVEVPRLFVLDQSGKILLETGDHEAAIALIRKTLGKSPCNLQGSR